MTTKFNKFLATAGESPTKASLKSLLASEYGLSLSNTAKAYYNVKGRGAKVVLKQLPQLLALFKVQYTNPATLSVKLSEIRKVLKAKQGKEVYAKSKLDDYFNLPEEARNQLRSDYVEKVKAANLNQTSVNIQDLIDSARVLDAEGDVYSKGVFLMLVSGMRSIELFKNTVEASGPRIKVSNLAKKRVADFSVERPVILISPDDFITRLEAFRQAFANKKIYENDCSLSANITRGLNKATRHVFENLKETTQAASMMRKYYGILAYELYADKATTNFNTFLQQILGHEHIATSFAYSTVSLEAPEDLVAEIKEEVIETPAPPPPPRYEKLSRNASEAAKLALLSRIVNENPGIANARLRALSGMGSTIVNKFLRDRAEAPP